LLERECAVWAADLRWDYRSSMEMVLRYVDSRILPGHVVVEDSAIVGYAFHVFEGTKGVMGDLFVDRNACESDAQATQIRDALADHVIAALQTTPGIRRLEAQLLLYRSGEIAGPFTRAGFRSHRRLFLELPLPMAKTVLGSSAVLQNGNGNGHANGNGGRRISGIFPAAEAMHGLTFRRWQETDFQASAPLITSAYDGHIDSEINDQYRSQAGAMRFLNNIVRFPGCGTFDPMSSIVATEPGGAMVGLLLCSRVRQEVGHVTQVCLLPNWRRKGLGRLLIEHCGQELVRRGCNALTLTVTEANTKAVDLYKKMGFSVRREFDAYVWEKP